jgi:hypothetical protein
MGHGASPKGLDEPTIFFFFFVGVLLVVTLTGGTLVDRRRTDEISEGYHGLNGKSLHVFNVEMRTGEEASLRAHAAASTSTMLATSHQFHAASKTRPFRSCRWRRRKECSLLLGCAVRLLTGIPCTSIADAAWSMALEDRSSSLDMLRLQYQ